MELLHSTSNIFKSLFDNVVCAYNGIEAFELYKQYHEKEKKYFDIIISDIEMPELNGIELSKRIFKLNKTQKIIIVSAYDDKHYLIDLINIGVQSFMQKPISQTNMLQILHDVCDSFYNEQVISLGDDFSYNISTSVLYHKDKLIDLGENETKLLTLLLTNNKQYFNTIEIFNHLFYNDIYKEFSQDSIKSIVKRLRKKIPDNTIVNTRQLGYSIHITS